MDEDTLAADTAELNLNISRTAYIAGLTEELSTARDKAHKAAILAEIERVSNRTAVAPALETAGTPALETTVAPELETA